MSRPLFTVTALRNDRDCERTTTTRVEAFSRRNQPCVSLRQPFRWSAYSREEIQALVDGLQDWLDRTDPAQ